MIKQLAMVFVGAMIGFGVAQFTQTPAEMERKSHRLESSTLSETLLESKHEISQPQPLKVRNRAVTAYLAEESVDIGATNALVPPQTEVQPDAVTSTEPESLDLRLASAPRSIGNESMDPEDISLPYSGTTGSYGDERLDPEQIDTTDLSSIVKEIGESGVDPEDPYSDGSDRNIRKEIGVAYSEPELI